MEPVFNIGRTVTNINHMLGQKGRFLKYQRINIMQISSFNHIAMKLEIHSTNTCCTHTAYYCSSYLVYINKNK